MIMEINQYDNNFLDYQNSEPGNKMTFFSKDYSCTSFQSSSEMLMEEKPVNTELRIEFESLDES